MAKGDKYKSLTEYLLCLENNQIELSFIELESITGGLPLSVYKYKKTAFNNKSGHSLSYGWLNAGFSAQLNEKINTVTFTKTDIMIKGQKPKKELLDNQKGFSLKTMKRILELEQKYNQDLYGESGYNTYLDYIFRTRSYTQLIVGYSKKAKELFDQVTKINIQTVTFRKQSKFDKGHKIFHLEHTTPISELIHKIFKENKDVEEVLQQCQVVLITKEENAKLNSMGYKSKRPQGWEKCYAECGIEIVMI